MELRLERIRGLGDVEHTPGKLYVDGKYFCQTLEDKERKEKVYAKTAIPVGRYKVTLTMSNRFKQLLPLLHDVPNFTGVRIHSGNTTAHTEGCILVGQDTNSKDAWLGNSRVTMTLLMRELVAATRAREDIWITVE